jgi:hypothetical protein
VTGCEKGQFRLAEGFGRQKLTKSVRSVESVSPERILLLHEMVERSVGFERIEDPSETPVSSAKDLPIDPAHTRYWI